jgi:predicted nucleic acid-binding protein
LTALEALTAAKRLFLDTAPVIYYMEANPRYLPTVDPVFNRLDRASLRCVTSPVTLAECLVGPYSKGDLRLAHACIERIVRGANTVFAVVDEARSTKAAELRARCNLSLPDAFQAATAIDMQCDSLLTNDTGLRRVTGLTVIVLDDVLADMQRPQGGPT